jgi:hypothetical protein
MEMNSRRCIELILMMKVFNTRQCLLGTSLIKPVNSQHQAGELCPLAQEALVGQLQQQMSQEGPQCAGTRLCAHSNRQHCLANPSERHERPSLNILDLE